MNMRPKTVRRLVILLLGCFVFAAVVGGLYTVRKQQLDRRATAAREAGMTAFEEGDYAAALEHLSVYVEKRREDPEVLFAYARSRSLVERPDGRHLGEAIALFIYLLEMQPDNREAQQILLELYIQSRHDHEAVDLADQLLAQDPQNLEAMRAKAIALTRLRRLDEAVALAEHYNELAPLDLQGQRLTYDLYYQLEHPADRVLARAKAMREAHPGDPRFEMLQGIALAMVHQTAQVQRMDEAQWQALKQELDLGEGQDRPEYWLRQAAGRTPPDAEFISMLTKLFDDLGSFDESRRLLDQAVGQSDDPQIMRVLIQRLWENGRLNEVVERLQDLDPATDDAYLLGFQAMALFQLERAGEAAPIVEAMAERRRDPAALAWATALGAQFQRPDLSPTEAIREYEAALTRDPGNAIIRFMFGQTYAQMDETELALQAWARASEAAPSWAAPYSAIARTLARTGRSQSAVREAEEAFRRAPDVSNAVALAIARFAALEAGNETQGSQLLQLLTAIQRERPGEPETLPLYITMLSRSGQQEQARQVLDSVLAAPQELGQEALLRLAGVSRAQQLGLEQRILDLAEQTYGMTPRLGWARASDLFASGRPQDGLELLRTAAQRSDNSALQWQIMIARYLELIQDPAAREAWIALGDQNPRTYEVQNLILDAPSARRDREFMARTIERVRELTGSEGYRWKLAQARWLLEGGSRERDSAAAAVLLTDLVHLSPQLSEPRLLLAEALQNAGDANGAIEQLRVAADLEPQRPQIRLKLAELLQSQGDFQQARAQYEQVAHNAHLDGPTRRALASRLAQEGRTDQAIEILRTLEAEDGDDPLRDRLMAEWHRREGRVEEARQIYDRMLTNPELDAAGLFSAADFFARHQEMEQAQKVLQRLEEPRFDPGVRELVLADFSARHIGSAEALEQYLAATQAAPRSSMVWQQLIRFHLGQDDLEQAAEAAEQALALLPDDHHLQALKLEARTRLAGTQGATPDLQPLIDAMSQDDRNRAAVEALQELQEAQRLGESEPQVLARLRRVADRHPQFFNVQQQVVQGYLALNQPAAAVTVATRTMDALPASPEAAELAVRAFAAASRWNEMLLAAQEWRQRSLEQPGRADLAIAQAQLQMGNGADALRHLQPYIEPAKADPQQGMQVIVTYARALISLGRESEAASLLLPQARASPQWRVQWLDLAPAHVRLEEAIQWIELGSDLIAADAPQEQLALANAWYNVGLRFSHRAAFDNTRRILQPVAESAAADLRVLLLMASAAEQVSDWAVAEQMYHRVLQQRDDMPVVHNNLAYVLLKRGGDLSEARELAGKAVAASPEIAGFHDTLGRIQASMGQRQEAIRSFERALQINRDHLDALIGLADLLAQGGDRARAASLLQRIDTLLPTSGPLAPAVQQQLDGVRSALQQTS